MPGPPKRPGKAGVCRLGREVQAGGAALLGSCWARSAVNTLAEDGVIGERPTEGGEKQARTLRGWEVWRALVGGTGGPQRRGDGVLGETGG